MIENPVSDSFTSRTYWEAYYKDKTADFHQVQLIGSVYDVYWSRSIRENARTVIEVGAYPGRYLAYVSAKFELVPTALDYQTDTSLIARTLEAVGISEYEVVNEDFLYWTPDRTYDLVLSIGFVEHFSNYKKVISKHFDLLKDGGKAFFVIPNKRGLRRLYGLLFDRENLRAHNIDAMRLKVFEEAARENNSVIEILEYFGPFQYGLHGRDRSFFRRLGFSVFRFIFKTLQLNQVVERFPSRFWSSVIVCVAKKQNVLVQPVHSS